MPSNITNIMPSKVKELIGNAQYQIVDVREPFEYADGHVPTALNIPLGTIPNSLESFDKSKKIVVFCRTGIRSMDAAEFLSEHDYDVYNMLGGFSDWTYDFEK